MIKALLIDDEQNNLDNLQFMLTHDCAGVQIVGTAQSASLARQWLQHNHADVVFLDINMPNETGLQMLAKIPNINFNVIFVTAHNEYALQAIKASAIDYILKPINIIDLQHAVQKLHNALNSTQYKQQNVELLNHLMQNLHQNTGPQKIALPQLGSTTFLDITDIVSVQADGNYSIIYKPNMQKLVVTKTLKDFEDILNPNHFVRIHKSHIVNLQFIKEYSTLDGGVVRMHDGNLWPVSRRQIELLLQKMKDGAILFFK